MKPPPSNPEFTKFTDALRHIVQVPKKSVQAKMDAEKQERKQQRETHSSHSSHSSTSDRVSRTQD